MRRGSFSHSRETSRRNRRAVLIGEGEEIGAPGCAGVVHRQVEASELCDCLRNGLRGCCGIAQIGGNGMHVDVGCLPTAGGEREQFVRVTGYRTKIRALSGEFDSDCRAGARLAPVTNATFPLNLVLSSGPLSLGITRPKCSGGKSGPRRWRERCRKCVKDYGAIRQSVLY
jgi:hypothetical protein